MRFIDRGVENQINSIDEKDAKRAMNVSCTICCNRGLHIECDRCPIKDAHEQIMGLFMDKKIIHKRLEEEREREREKEREREVSRKMWLEQERHDRVMDLLEKRRSQLLESTTEPQLDGYRHQWYAFIDDIEDNFY